LGFVLGAISRSSMLFQGGVEPPHSKVPSALKDLYL
jgi:hypothetical protein